MKNRRLVIDLKDEVYGLALAKGLSNYYSGLVIGLRGEEGDEALKDASDEDYMLFKDRIIYKYSNLHSIANQIGLISHRKEEVDACLRVGFVAMHGGCGCTSITEMVGRAAAMYHGKRVMVIHLDYFGDPFANAGGKTINRLLYDQIYDGKVSHLSPDEYGIYHLNCLVGANPLCTENTEDIANLLNTLIDKLSINLTIFDFGFFYGPGNEKLIEAAANDYKLFAVYSDKNYEYRVNIYEELTEGLKFSGKILNDVKGIDYEDATIGYSKESFDYREGKPYIDNVLNFSMDLVKFTENLL